ncbi:MAG: VWA domain-containing protein [Planctomycetota bacterium]|nr:VWA domain-containing protein [Planctomycetota bacterium]
MERVVEDLLDEAYYKAAPAHDEPGFGALTSDRGPLPLKALSVSGRIVGLQYRLTVTQTFVNTHPEPLEATYIFPLPDRAAVSRFAMTVGKRRIEGVLKERGEARREYAQAIEEGRRAAIAEEERPNVFTMRAGNILPRESAEVELVLDGPLCLDLGEATFRFPLVVAPRYIPGNVLPGDPVGDGTEPDTDAVPDASRITPPVLLPGFRNPVRLKIEVDVDPAGLPFKDFRSSLHAVASEGLGQGKMRIRVQPGERLNRDFILRFRIGGEALATSLKLSPDEKQGAGEGTFTLTVVPPEGLVQAQKPRDLVFVLDRSGSMNGWKMAAARRAMGSMVETLNPRDRFDILAFDDRVESFRQSAQGGLRRGETSFWNEADTGPWAKADDRTRVRAVEFLQKIESRGGTEMAQPLIEAVIKLASTADPARDMAVVLATDGQVGNEAQMLRDLKTRLKDIRIFALGIDVAANDGFLEQLARISGGTCETVESEERLWEVMDRVHRKIGTPVLTDLALRPEGLAVDPDSVAPKRLPQLFAGVPVVVQGRYKGEARGTIELRGQDAAGQPWSQKLDGVETANASAEKIWARGHLRDLEDRAAAGEGDVRECKRRILDVSLGHGVLCRYTSFVAVDAKEIANKTETLHRIVQPVEKPEGWAMQREARGGRPADGMLCMSLSMKHPIPPPKPKKSRARKSKELKESVAVPGPKQEAPPEPPVQGAAMTSGMALQDALDLAQPMEAVSFDAQPEQRPDETTMYAAIACDESAPDSTRHSGALAGGVAMAMPPEPPPPASVSAPAPAPATPNVPRLQQPSVVTAHAAAQAASGLSATFWAILTAILVAIGMLIAWFLFWTPKEGLTPPQPAPKPRDPRQPALLERAEPPARYV